ncbi:aminodeoxychorismate/anthranilate synthase component II [Sphingomicrobium sp. XHP0235]|uniref:anthranilate synthase component II n=1 Tax=Sphingomicrobium aquimarinum TaxID=3133971 RepID=UPI0031FE4650
MTLLVIDNRDSFTFNLVDAFAVAGAQVSVVRNSIAAEAAIERAGDGAILLSPGPGAPTDAGSCLAICAAARRRVPLIGICLGHQAIVEAAGGTVVRAPEPHHAKVTRLDHPGDGIFAGLPSPLAIGRYHSLATPTDSVPHNFTVDSTHENFAMAVRDDHGLQLGLQFHPESILTPRGDILIANLLTWADAASARHRRAA